MDLYGTNRFCNAHRHRHPPGAILPSPDLRRSSTRSRRGPPRGWGSSSLQLPGRHRSARSTWDAMMVDVGWWWLILVDAGWRWLKLLDLGWWLTQSHGSLRFFDPYSELRKIQSRSWQGSLGVYPPVIKHGWRENGLFISDFPKKSSIQLQFGDFPAGHVWLPEGKMM